MSKKEELRPLDASGGSTEPILEGVSEQWEYMLQGLDPILVRVLASVYSTPENYSHWLEQYYAENKSPGGLSPELRAEIRSLAARVQEARQSLIEPQT